MLWGKKHEGREGEEKSNYSEAHVTEDTRDKRSEEGTGKEREEYEKKRVTAAEAQ